MGRWAPKYVIGLTGNIATGKSTVRKMLENLGAQTIDADDLAHRAMSPGGPAYAPVIETFGKWILDPDGRTINRNKLSLVVFASPEALSQLEAITHPSVSQAIDILIGRGKQPIVVVEAIKLLEGALASQVDSVWVVNASPEAQLKRLMTKRNMSELEARRRIEAQNSQADKLSKASVVITNDGSLEQVWEQVQPEWEKIVSGIERNRPTREVAVTPKVATLPDTPTAVLPRPAPNVGTGPAVRSGQALASTQLAPSPAAPTATPAPTQAAAPSAAAKPAAQPAPTPPVAPPKPSPVIQIEVRRGLPKDSDAIARLLSQNNGRPVSHGQVMQTFGEKSLFMAESGGKLLGLAGIQVENLIARIDEFVLAPEAPVVPVIKALLEGVESAARDLLSEVGFVFMSRNAPPSTVQAFLDQGYERVVIDALRIPAWREAAAEMQRADRQILMKKLRDSLVLTPV